MDILVKTQTSKFIGELLKPVVHTALNRSFHCGCMGEDDTITLVWMKRFAWFSLIYKRKKNEVASVWIGTRNGLL